MTLAQLKDFFVLSFNLDDRKTLEGMPVIVKDDEGNMLEIDQISIKPLVAVIYVKKVNPS